MLNRPGTRPDLAAAMLLCVCLVIPPGPDIAEDRPAHGGDYESQVFDGTILTMSHKNNSLVYDMDSGSYTFCDDTVAVLYQVRRNDGPRFLLELFSFSDHQDTGRSWHKRQTRPFDVTRDLVLEGEAETRDDFDYSVAYVRTAENDFYLFLSFSYRESSNGRRTFHNRLLYYPVNGNDDHPEAVTDNALDLTSVFPEPNHQIRYRKIHVCPDVFGSSNTRSGNFNLNLSFETHDLDGRDEKVKLGDKPGTYASASHCFYISFSMDHDGKGHPLLHIESVDVIDLCFESRVGDNRRFWYDDANKIRHSGLVFREDGSFTSVFTTAGIFYPQQDVVLLYDPVEGVGTVSWDIHRGALVDENWPCGMLYDHPTYFSSISQFGAPGLIIIRGINYQYRGHPKFRETHVFEHSNLVRFMRSRKDDRPEISNKRIYIEKDPREKNWSSRFVHVDAGVTDPSGRESAFLLETFDSESGTHNSVVRLQIHSASSDACDLTDYDVERILYSDGDVFDARYLLHTRSGRKNYISVFSNMRDPTKNRFVIHHRSL